MKTLDGPEFTPWSFEGQLFAIPTDFPVAVEVSSIQKTFAIISKGSQMLVFNVFGHFLYNFRISEHVSFSVMKEPSTDGILVMNKAAEVKYNKIPYPNNCRFIFCASKVLVT